MTTCRTKPPGRRRLGALHAAAVFCVAGMARAQEPTTAQCLAASDASTEYAKAHRLRAERAELLVCSAASCPAEIRTECIRGIENVNVAIPTIIFEAKDSAGRDVVATRVTMDGEVLTQRLEGVALSVDPGERTFTFETAGLPLVRKTFVIREAEKSRRERVTLDSPASPPKVDARRGLDTQRILAIVSAGVGVVGAGIGTGFGFDAMFKRKDAEHVCPDQCADTSGAARWHEAMSSGDMSTAAFVLGGVALGGAVALWLTSSMRSTTDPGLQVAIGPGIIRMRGEW
ncbi:MAG: hypothetical protein M3O46_05435 [Myxococcota bacterium]|nr:hypothetical protein [Myxococcota bacterium]